MEFKYAVLIDDGRIGLPALMSDNKGDPFLFDNHLEAAFAAREDLMKHKDPERIDIIVLYKPSSKSIVFRRDKFRYMPECVIRTY